MSQVDPRQAQQVHPTQDDQVVRSLSEVVGGPLGSHSAGHSWWTPLRVILALTAICLSLGMLNNKACWDDSWQSNDVRYAHMCYSDMPYLYGGRGLDNQHWPYSDDPTLRATVEAMEYPVGISYWAYGASLVTKIFAENNEEPIKEMKAFVAINVLGFAVIALISAALLTRVNPQRPYDAAGFALAPVLALGFMINWDLLAVGFIAGALWAWTRAEEEPEQSKWPILAGLMIGLGTAAKLYPLFLLGGLLIICWRNKRWRDFSFAVAAASASWALANLPAILTGPADWKRFWEFNSERTADLGSIWLVWSQAFDKAFSAHTINLGSWVFFGAWCVGVLALGLLAPRTPRFAQLGFLIVVGFLLINKVYSPQYMLWLLPLAALARPRWRDLLIWQVGELIYFGSVWFYLAGYLDPATGDDRTFYWLAILVRLAAELYLAAVVSRDILRPDHDPVQVDPVQVDPVPQDPVKQAVEDTALTS